MKKEEKTHIFATYATQILVTKKRTLLEFAENVELTEILES